MTHFHYPIYKRVIGVSYIIVNFCDVQCQCMFDKRPLLIVDVQVLTWFGKHCPDEARGFLDVTVGRWAQRHLTLHQGIRIT
jgi:hypothetical protein